ncbi:MAG: HAD family hydrolase [Microbacteriaceae bacterium]
MPEAVPTTPTERPIIAFFDVDNTLLRGASIYHVGLGAWRTGLIRKRDIARFAWHQARFVAVGENHKHLGQIRDRGLELVGGHTVDDLVALADEVYHRDIEPKLWPQTVELTREHLAKGHEVWLITATPQIVAEVIARKLGLTGALGTVAEAVDGVFTGQLSGPVLHGSHKAIAAESLARRLGAALSDCWAYSDSRNDIPLLSIVGNRVVVNPDAALRRYARVEQWPVLTLDPASIRAARKRVAREARASRARR